MSGHADKWFTNGNDAVSFSGCGKGIDEGLNELDNSVDTMNPYYDTSADNAKRGMFCCTRCRSDRLQAMVETSTSVRNTGKNYSIGKGLLGKILFGKNGLLLGCLGQKHRTRVYTDNRYYWVCLDCGNKFRNAEDWNKEVKSKKYLQKKKAFIAAITGAIGLVFFLQNNLLHYISVAPIIIACIYGLSSFVSWIMIKKEKREIFELINKSSN